MDAEMNFDSAMKKAGNIVELSYVHDEEDSPKDFHNTADSFSTGELDAPPGDEGSQEVKSSGVHADPLIGSEAKRESREFQQLWNCPDGVRDDPESLKLRNLEEGSVPGEVTSGAKMDDDHCGVEGSDGDAALLKTTGSGNAKKVKRTRRNAKKVPTPTSFHCSHPDVDGGGGKRVMYSREEMVAMRFFGVVQQKRLWREIYNGLGSAAAEYANLVDERNPNINQRNSPISVGILGPSAGAGRTNSYNIIVHPYPNTIKTFYSPEWPYITYGF